MSLNRIKYIFLLISFKEKMHREKADLRAVFQKSPGGNQKGISMA